MVSYWWVETLVMGEVKSLRSVLKIRGYEGKGVTPTCVKELS